jgi:hypothetical protein
MPTTTASRNRADRYECVRLRGRFVRRRGGEANTGSPACSADPGGASGRLLCMVVASHGRPPAGAASGAGYGEELPVAVDASQ